MGNGRHHGYDSVSKYFQRECSGYLYLGRPITAVVYIHISSIIIVTYVCTCVRRSLLHDVPCPRNGTTKLQDAHKINWHRQLHTTNSKLFFPKHLICGCHATTYQIISVAKHAHKQGTNTSSAARHNTHDLVWEEIQKLQASM